jgi:hypothetical protein
MCLVAKGGMWSPLYTAFFAFRCAGLRVCRASYESGLVGTSMILSRATYCIHRDRARIPIHSHSRVGHARSHQMPSHRGRKGPKIHRRFTKISPRIHRNRPEIHPRPTPDREGKIPSKNLPRIHPRVDFSEARTQIILK